jgi:hypothetical protein
LTLGGGWGWLAGKYGLTVDNLISADVVTADGRFLTASSTENQDLLWALKGGDGNFGVVTSFQFKLYPVTDVLGGVLARPLDRAADVLRFFREFTRDVPDDLGIVINSPPLPGGRAVATVVCYSGPEEEGKKVIKPLREFGPPMLDTVKKMKYEDMVRMLDRTLLPSGLHNYWKSSYFGTLSDEMIGTIVSIIKRAPSPLSRFAIEVWSGEAARKPPTETAFPIRAKLYNFLLVALWQDPTDADKNLEWIRSSWQSVQPFLTSKVYVNYLMQEDEERVKAAYGENYERLVALKKKYDPTNLFRVNQNIKPA